MYVTIDDCNASFDKGTFVVNGKPYSLVVPEYKQYGLEHGMQLKVDALDCSMMIWPGCIWPMACRLIM